MFDDEIKSIYFRHLDDECFTPITKALEVFNIIRSSRFIKNNHEKAEVIDDLISSGGEGGVLNQSAENIVVSPVTEMIITNPVTETLIETVNNLSSLF